MTNVQRWKNKLNEINVLLMKVPTDANERCAQARKLKALSGQLFTLAVCCFAPDSLRVAQKR